MLALAATLLIRLAAPAGALGSTNFTETLYWASAGATGSRLCNWNLRTRYTVQFNQRYGSRVRALTRYHVSKYGPDPDLITTSSCRSSSVSGHQEDRDHKLAMDRFERVLRDLELQFGPGGGIPPQ